MKRQTWILVILIITLLMMSACSAQPATVTIEPADEAAEPADADEPADDSTGQADETGDAGESEEPGEPEELVEAVEYGSLAVFEIIHRSENRKVADVCGNHWHGTLPALEAGETLSLGAFLEDEFGEEIMLDGDHYAFSGGVAEGATAGIVSFVDHGDHLDVIGDQAGETWVVFRLLHEGKIMYETPTMMVVVH